MRISVVHSTQYAFDAPVFLEPHTFRLRPRSDAAQHLTQYALDISPAPTGQTWCLDQDGNVVLAAWFREQVTELSVMSSFQVETLRENPFDFLARSALSRGADRRSGRMAARRRPRWTRSRDRSRGRACRF